MKFLLTNDDGIHAPGLEALEAAARQLGEVVTVAPLQTLSGCSHQTTTDRELVLVEIGPARFAIDGTPADCTRLGLLHLVPDADWVLSGINDGGNLGVDVLMSGTVAAVREAVLLNRPGIAFSHYHRRGSMLQWDTVGSQAVHILRQLLVEPLPRRAYWNVNFPDPPLAALPPRIPSCPLDANPLDVRFEQQSASFHFRGNYHQRPRTPGSDVDVCFSGQVALSLVQVDPFC